ncbi:FeS assembly protein SufD [Chondrocystis sp. NIES-4102]|nr:FeS assembly protein SufD [Chondrocystis sp. NIES-4102]
MAVQIPFTTITEISDTSVVGDGFFADLLQLNQPPTDQPQWLKEIRQQFITLSANLSLPTRQDEDWRFIDLSPLKQEKFVAGGANVSVNYDLSSTEIASCHLVFVNGLYSAELSDTSALPKGVYVGNLGNLPSEYDAAKYLAKQHNQKAAFTALNTAGSLDVAVIWVAKDVKVESPIHLVFIADGDDTIFIQPRTLVIAQTGADITLVEEYRGRGKYFTNAVTEIFVEANAKINHTRLQQESETSFHIATTAVSQARDSHYTINELNLGAKIFRHNPEILQQGEQTETNLNGLTVATGEQTADTHSIIALTKPYGTTDQLHKCIISDRAQTIFNGKVFVPKEAQLTDATQLNRNLLLSPKARVNTKPELQITADNVKCAHGATVSQLEAEEIFYLRSRGLSEADANQLLIDAFAAEIIDRIPVEFLRTKITQIIEKKILQKT